MPTDPQCTGPFSDAFECPVHDPRKRVSAPESDIAEVSEQKKEIQRLRAKVAILTRARDHWKRLADRFFKEKHEGPMFLEDCDRVEANLTK